LAAALPPYVMVAVESDDPIPGDYSMICIKAVIVERELSRTFYGKLKPISESFVPDALVVSARSSRGGQAGHNVGCLLRDVARDEVQRGQVLAAIGSITPITDFEVYVLTKESRVGLARETARQMAAEVNAQLEVGAPSALGFEPISIPAVRQRRLDHHEHIRRPSLHTIRRYSSATQHLLNFLRDVRPLQRIADFREVQAEELVRSLARNLQSRSMSPPMGTPTQANAAFETTGELKYVLETCSTLLSPRLASWLNAGLSSLLLPNHTA